MIDWVSAYVSLDVFPEDIRRDLLLRGDRIMRFSPLTGEVGYETSAWDSVRSDSHSVVVRVTGTSLWMQGSPARVIGDGDTVFSSGASKAEDLVGCVERMAAFACGHLGVHSPETEAWQVTRVDVTRHYCLDSLVEVRQLLAFLRNAEGGRYRVNQPDGDTVYWNKSSRYKKAKAYAKGPHLRYQMGRKGYQGRRYGEQELCEAERLIRLELTLFRRYWERNLSLASWQGLTKDVLDKEWREYFARFIGQTIMNDEALKARIGEVASTVGQAKAAYLMWYLIKSMGWELARENTSARTWYRNLRILRDAGLKVTELGNGKIMPFRIQKVISGREVHSWSELRRVA